MAIIREFSQAKRQRPEDQYRPAGEEPVVCPKCGEESIFKWTSQKYGGWNTTCFSSACAEPIPIGRILGDVTTFNEQEYRIPGQPDIWYPEASKGGYSEALRVEIKKILESWGFIKISFKSPSNEEMKNDEEGKLIYETIITGIHKDPNVNIRYRTAPNTHMVLTFKNKYGKISIKTGRDYSKNAPRNYQGWDRAIHAISKYCEDNKIKANIHSSDIFATVPGREELREQSARGILDARKEATLSQIRHYLYKNSSLRDDIKRNNERISELKTQYKADFGEDCPKVKGEE